MGVLTLHASTCLWLSPLISRQIVRTGHEAAHGDAIEALILIFPD